MMAKFHVIEGGTPPDSPAEEVRVRLRKTRQRGIPQCGTCAGREYVTARTGRVSTKLCVICLMQGRRREMNTI